ncbi:polysaccharide biosynthesis C-terminal domain-containing protein [Paraglaciecola sp. L3A3]|uniref:oligosaccharide flippase family protein n=1 Tax=Paraglaciecola sp. L3A3 TaxID=2686358 RepID=UPI00131C191E|nr:polysaccharide biosynthesis C-terminal domain-containing protein [Paraglaciecola sp. L3A3]
MASFTQDLLSVLKSKVTVLLCGVFTSIITARYLGAAGSGELATLIVIPDLLMIVGSLGIRQSAAFFIGKEKYSDEKIFSNVLGMWLITSLLCMLMSWVFLRYVTNSTFSTTLILLALLPIPFALLSTYSSGVFLGKNKIKDFNSVNWIPNVVQLASYVLLIMLIPLGIEGALIGRALGYIIVIYFIWRKLTAIVPIKFSFDLKVIKELLALGGIYAISLIIINFNYKIDVILLEKFSTLHEVGIYTKGAVIVEKLWEIPSLLGAIIFARSATAKNSKLFSYKVAQLLRICFVVIFIACIVFFVFSELIMTTMYGDEFLASSQVQRILLPGIFFMTILKVLNMDLAGRGKPWLALYAMLPSLVVNIALNWLWDEKYGANGAAAASMISYTVSAILFLIVYSRSVGISIKEIFRYSTEDFILVKQKILKR